MLPIRDDNPTRSRAVVNYLLIALNCGVFILQFLANFVGGDAWVIPGFGLVPSRLMQDPQGEAFTILTSMFMHGGLGHLLGNVYFLYIFGDNVEDELGHFRYILFYLLSGLGAALAQIMIDPASQVPMVGASGAIAGVLAGYMVLYPRAPITVLNPIPLLWILFGFFIVLPAWAVAGLWFVWNLMSGIESLGLGATNGVAFFAHVGGFVVGLLLIRPLRPQRPVLRGGGAWQGWLPPERATRNRRSWDR